MQIRCEFTKIDFDSWPRRKHFLTFGKSDYPYLGLTTAVDVSCLREWCIDTKQDFFYAFLYAIMKAANKVVNFRYRIADDEIIECESVDPSFNVVDRQSGSSYFAVAPMQKKLAEFIEKAEAARQRALQKHTYSSNRVDLIHVSYLPSFGMSDMIQPLGLSANGTIPRFVWGTTLQNENCAMVPFSVTGHHGLFDGKHISLLLRGIQTLLEKPESL